MQTMLIGKGASVVRCASTTTDVGINHSKLTEDVLVLLLELMWVCVCVCVCV